MNVEPNLLDRAKALRPLIESEAKQTDRELTLTAPVVEALSDNQLFHMMVPKEFGGLECDSDTILDVFEELSHQDGSIGWTQMANASATSYVSFLDPEVGARMLDVGPGSVCAGQFAPLGQVAREAGGFRVSGHYGFGSGSAHASFLGGAGILMESETAPEMLPNQMPAYLCYFVPRDGVELQGGWDSMGLRGTGSFDYEVLPQHVDGGSAFFLFDPQVRTGGTLFRLGATALAGLGHAGWGLGVAQRALDEIVEIAEAGRTRMGAEPLANQQIFQRTLGEMTLAVQSVRLLSHDVFGGALRHLEAGNPMTKSWNDQVMASVAYMTQICEEATLFAFRMAGSHGLRNPSTVQNCFRDIMTGGLHLFVDRRSYESIAQARLGIS